MKLPFPSGLYMDKYINDNQNLTKIKTPKISGGTYINLSGMENYYTKLLNDDKYDKQTIIYSLFSYISECIINIIINLKKEQEFSTIIITGGVASNSTIRKLVLDRIGNYYKIIFPSVKNSSDNAIGTAFLPIIDRWYNET